VLIRDVAYGMLPKAVRARWHYEVGRYVEERSGDRADEFVALLAEHFGRAASLGEEAGVSPEHIADAVAAQGSDDELTAALTLLRRRLTGPPADDRSRERALGLLVRRGYELELAYDAVRAFEREGRAEAA